MWRGLALFAVLGACGFQSSAGPADAKSDAPFHEDAAIDAAIDASVPLYCDPNDPHLMGCYQFENTTQDGSSYHLDATMNNVSFVAGKVGKAMQFGNDSAADIGDSSVFNVTALTIEAWINPSQLPSNGDRANIIDVDRQYAMFLHADGSITCALVNALPSLDTTTKITVNQWTHVACTYDGDAAAVYIDGSASATGTGGNNLGTSGTTGMSFAADNNPPSESDRARMSGLIDEVRLMDVARTAQQICADAGKSSCP